MNESLVNFRNSKNLTQYEISQNIGTTQSYYSKIELGLRNPSFNFLVKFKKAYTDVCIDEIFFK